MKQNWFSQKSFISQKDFCDIITLPPSREQNKIFHFWLFNFQQKTTTQKKRQMYNYQNFTRVSKIPRTHNFSSCYAWTRNIYYRRRFRRFSKWLTNTLASASPMEKWLSVALLSLARRYHRITRIIKIRSRPARPHVLGAIYNGVLTISP